MIVEKARLIAPYCGQLMDLLVPRDQLVEQFAYAKHLPLCADKRPRRM